MKLTFNIKQWALILGPLVCVLMLLLPFDMVNPATDKVLAVAAWMIIWWITEVVSISVTALIPLVIFPLIGVANIQEVAASYGNHIIFLFFGGFVLALALEKVNLHRRIALNIIKLTGTSPDKVVLGFMLSTALLSMWISNTASTVVMLPIAISVIKLLSQDADGYSSKDANFALSIMLGIAFAANIGGIATLIGTPPNVVLAGVLEKEYDIQISFLHWLLFGLPFSAILLAITYLVVVKWMYPSQLEHMSDAEKVIQVELDKLGKISIVELKVLLIFAITVLLWIFRTLITYYLPDVGLSDAGISVLGALAMFVISKDFKKGEQILDWADTEKLPWGILILFGGGLALAGALAGVGVIDSIGHYISTIDGLSIFWVMFILVLIMLFMTELMSNVALVAIFVPVVAGIAIGLEVPLLHLCIPVTMASSCAFMLPMATPPNAIVFASGHIKVHQMVRVGLVLNLISVLLIAVVGYLVVPYLF